MDRTESSSRLTGAKLANRLEPWFALQVDFAARCAALSGKSLGWGVTHYTAIYKRMGFGPNARGELAPGWSRIRAAIDRAPDAREALAIIMAEMRGRVVGYRHYSHDLFGCFSFDAPPETDHVKLHFIPDHSDARHGPLHITCRENRIAELTAMFSHIRVRYGSRAQRVRGLSWLYHTRAYRSLFPDIFAASVQRDRNAGALPQGMRYWGQFLTHRGHLRPAVCKAFHARLPDLSLERLADTFPCPPMTATAPIEAFYEAYLS